MLSEIKSLYVAIPRTAKEASETTKETLKQSKEKTNWHYQEPEVLGGDQTTDESMNTGQKYIVWHCTCHHQKADKYID